MIVTDWLIANLGSVATGAVVLAVVALIVIGMIKGRKKGKSSCGCGCAECPMAGKCHAGKQENE